jgi:hypothetical protein
MKTQHPVRSLCEALEVSSSGYYDWVYRQTKLGPRAQENASLVTRITQIHLESRKTYGSPRIQQELLKRGHSHGRNRPFNAPGTALRPCQRAIQGLHH